MTIRKTVLAASAVVAMSAALVAGPAAAWEPKKPVDFVIMAGKGGGADKMARLLQSVIDKYNLSSKPFVPVNKPGGSGAEALVHLNKTKGLAKDHTIMVTLNSFYTTPMRQPKLKVDPLTFTPIARMAEDTFCLWVHKDSGVKTVDEYVAAVKAKGDGGWLMGGTGKASEDNLLTNFLNRTYDLKIKYIPFKGGGGVAKALAGGNVNSSVNNPSEALGFYEAGTVLPIACFTPERIGLFPDAPTFKELGNDYSYFMQRSVVGAPGMSAEAAKWYQDLFQTVFTSDEWNKYRKAKALQGEYLTGKGLQDYWKVENTRHMKMLKEIGEI